MKVASDEVGPITQGTWAGIAPARTPHLPFGLVQCLGRESVTCRVVGYRPGPGSGTAAATRQLARADRCRCQRDNAGAPPSRLGEAPRSVGSLWSTHARQLEVPVS